MQRREFLALPAILPVIEAPQGGPARQWYEVRRFQLRNGPQQSTTVNYLRDAYVPALNRAGVKPVGVFNVSLGETPTIFVLIPHASLDSIGAVRARVGQDAEYLKAAEPFSAATHAQPAYERIDTSVLQAFTKVPVLEVPDIKKPRIFEWRRYESHSLRASRKKIEMFNDAGEIAIFRRLGLRPVFFGEAVIAPRMPHLQYMVVFDNMEAREKAWAAFRTDDEWRKLSAMPEFANTVSNISVTFLNPAPFSQI
jgi:hypothetical protein